MISTKIIELIWRSLAVVSAMDSENSAKRGEGRLLCFNLRPLRQSDEASLRNLDMECYPVRYDDAYYWRAIGGSLFTRACEDASGTLVGALTARLCLDRNCEDGRLIGFDWKDPIGDPESLYIMTLGVATDFRRLGIASLLLQRALRLCWRRRTCKAVFLHTAANNYEAQQFYARHNFRRVQTLPEYYAIGDGHVDACLYVLYVNGGIPAGLWTPVAYCLHNSCSCLLSRLSPSVPGIVVAVEDDAEAEEKVLLRCGERGSVTEEPTRISVDEVSVASLSSHVTDSMMRDSPAQRWMSVEKRSGVVFV